MKRDQLMRELREHFPELRSDLDAIGVSGLATLEVGRLRALCQRAIDSEDRELLDRCFNFTRSGVVAGNDAVRNTIGISFVKQLNFQDGKVPRRWAYDLLPPVLQDHARALGVEPE